MKRKKRAYTRKATPIKRISAKERCAIMLMQFQGILESERAQVLRMIGQRITYLNQFQDDTNAKRIIVLEKIQLHMLGAKVKL